MKKILPIIIIGILILSGLGAVALPDLEIKQEKMTLYFSQLFIQQKDNLAIGTGWNGNRYGCTCPMETGRLEQHNVRNRPRLHRKLPDDFPDKSLHHPKRPNHLK